MKQIILIIAVILFSLSLQAQIVKSIKITELEETLLKSDSPLILNFWATFCVPCLEEIPYFISLSKKYEDKGLKLIFVSLDLKDAVPKKMIATAKKFKMDSPLLWLNESNADYFCNKIDSSWSGGIPGSLFINNKTGYRRFFEEQLTKKELENEILKMISFTKKDEVN